MKDRLLNVFSGAGLVVWCFLSIHMYIALFIVHLISFPLMALDLVPYILFGKQPFYKLHNYTGDIIDLSGEF